ncbi:uncharacterized protein MONOS_13996 [Monocercomonoides exilis]|uniref:uncharacterized protein n=1 Tax=Monocercomonoides exilis TaxID=2049356 RepID=UPI003559973C|nr:hypothetical protein MONOS_13996 [Monocercomonoides exilis]|eukprot:MONOS_13996.1-p1 / transcript=MONOS_13996.1 / gene=MONOS_13996 / organism=Monocercomonoides_exilis_PA203 / gene_product=unspecified product / transcript_product=unspecified product / location=Mono_scaffold00918:22382-24003(+) / protein_length=418 / sequence_SO=supercontig / SO=protein_coding / is_pseudo=false
MQNRSNEACSPSTTMSTQTTCLMSSCSFSSVSDTYDGGIVHSLNNPYASLTASNTSFVRCCRTRNVVCEGNAEVPLKPDRQNETFNGANTFTWCEWSESKATGKGETYSDGTSNGGAIFMYGQSSATVSVSHCAFKECVAYYAGGGIHCYSINSVEIVNNTFDSCNAQNRYGGGVFVYTISSCVRISGCEFQNCKANNAGGGLFLENFQVSGTGCIEAENGGGESACVFDCGFTSCSLSSSSGGGMYCRTVPVTFKMRSIQFISCSAAANGGGSWAYQYTEKKDWLKDKTIYVSANGNDEHELCGANESNPCLTVKKAFEMSEVQISLAITLLDGNHQNETTTIKIGEKKISVVGTGKEKSLIGTEKLSSSSARALLSVMSGYLGMSKLMVDCNSNSSTSPSVAVVSDGAGGTLSRE